MIESVIFCAVRIPNVHGAVCVPHEIFWYFATHKQDFGAVFLKEEILSEPCTNDSI